MKKVSLFLLLCLLVIGMAKPMKVSAGTFSTGITSGGYYHGITAGSTGNATRYSLVYSFYYDGKKVNDGPFSVTVKENVQTTASASVSTTLSSAAGAEIDVFGSNANAQISRSIEAGVGIAYSKSVSLSANPTWNFKSGESPKGYYVYETFTRGYSSYIQYTKVKCKTGKTVKNNRKTISYSPRKNYQPTGQKNFYKNDPQISGIYEHIYY